MEVKPFNPREAVNILSSPEGDMADARRILALARLLGWAVLGQRHSRHRIRRLEANQVGRATLAALIDRELQAAPIDKDKIIGILSVFVASGGFRRGLQGPGAKFLLKRAKSNLRALQYVYLITAYMCRYHSHFPAGDKLNIEDAKRFVMKWEPEDPTYGLSKISKIWEQYKRAAPHIFAFYPVLKRVQNAAPVEQVACWFETFALDESRLSRVIGRAAYAADVLDKHARDVRIGDFDQIKRVVPSLRSFSALELTILESIDRKAPIR